MKKLVTILLCLPMIGFGQLAQDYIRLDENISFSESDTSSQKSQIINISPISLIMGELSLSYEKKFDIGHSVTIGIPIYFKRDIANMRFVRVLSPFFDSELYDDEASYNSTVNDILDDTEKIGYLSGFGLNLKYKLYLDKTAPTLTGFYFSPAYSFSKLNVKIDASEADIAYIVQKHFYPSIFDNVLSYKLDGDIKTNTISLNFGHQWIRDWFSIDVNIGMGRYSLSYDFRQEIYDYNMSVGLPSDWPDSFEGKEVIWLPRMGLNLGFAF